MKINDYLKQAETFEQSQIEQIKARHNSLRLFLLFSMASNILLASSLIVLLPLKELIPYVIQVDKSTGNQVVISSLTHEEYTPSEAEDKANIARYIRAREGYVFDTLQRDYNLVSVLSDEEIFKDYQKIFFGETSRDNTYGDKVVLEPRIISISLKDSNGTKTAIVRVEIAKKDIQKQTVDFKTSLVNLSYRYDTTNIVDNVSRLDNPLGFKVHYYRIDDEAQ
ncbi:MAG: type IV secretion system protein [Neisseriaceae bacterium]|nr:MAG: type IV secretion system protein [Neisseriaceae bacterium]